MTGRISTLIVFASSLLIGGVGATQQAAEHQQEYLITAQDVLSITVLDHANLNGKYTVQPDGSVSIPLVGRVPTAGLTLSEFEARLVRVLADGYILQPRVSVAVEQFRGRKVFVFGNIGSPGTYALGDQQTLIEILAKAGYGGASEAIIVRPNRPSGMLTLPDQVGEGEVIRVNLRELEKGVEQGSLARNVVLKDGDTIFVPRVDVTRVFVSGMVRTPGAYPVTEGTTVLQVLSLAGGPTEQAALNRIRILRIEDGKQKTVKVKLTDLVRPGDTIHVPERYF